MTCGKSDCGRGTTKTPDERFHMLRSELDGAAIKIANLIRAHGGLATKSDMTLEEAWRLINAFDKAASDRISEIRHDLDEARRIKDFCLAKAAGSPFFHEKAEQADRIIKSLEKQLEPKLGFKEGGE